MYSLHYIALESDVVDWVLIEFSVNELFKKMINVRPLCKALAIKASRDLNEVPARVPEDIETFREWVLTQKHLRIPVGERYVL